MSVSRRLVVDMLIAAMKERPDDFTFDDHTVTDKATGHAYWISNGWLSGAVYKPFELWFGAWHSLRFHRALRSLKAYKAAKALQGHIKQAGQNV